VVSKRARFKFGNIVIKQLEIIGDFLFSRPPTEGIMN